MSVQCRPARAPRSIRDRLGPYRPDARQNGANARCRWIAAVHKNAGKPGGRRQSGLPRVGMDIARVNTELSGQSGPCRPPELSSGACMSVQSSAPVTMLVTRHIAPERYGDFLAWMRQGEILAAGFPGFLGSGVLLPPEGGDQYQIVLRFADA